ncbi:hypothetical protein HHI36_015107 [Cryptolaemus montrouzieri]|uniref:Uncharacterized protein n=1 Tax=Cryptolaemus montrouzieri TaxID=559131 RepID=A0ABD2N4Z7_9CUCU
MKDKFDKVANENKVLKSELGDINEQVAVLNDKFNNNTGEIMTEMKDREHRARNIIIYNRYESALTDLEKRISHDTGEVGSMMELAGIRAEQIDKVVRMGKKGTRARRVKVFTSPRACWENLEEQKCNVLITKG